MFERFTDRARRVVVLAQEEARLLNHSYIGTEHLLLGLIHEGEGVGARALEDLGVSLDAVRTQVREIIGQPAATAVGGHVPFTPRAKKVLELSLREALQLGHNYIGTEHILLGLIHEGEGVAAKVLARLGADVSGVRQQVIQMLSADAPRATPPTDPSPLRGHTPAGWAVTVAARRLAGSEAVGSQHYLLAALGDESSVAARALASLGVTREQLEQALRDLGTAGTSDETPEAAGARALRLVLDAQPIRIEIEDPELAAILMPLLEGRLLPPSIGGGEPLAASFPNLWKAVSETVLDVAGRAAAAADPEKPRE